MSVSIQKDQNCRSQKISIVTIFSYNTFYIVKEIYYKKYIEVEIDGYPNNVINY